MLGLKEDRETLLFQYLKPEENNQLSLLNGSDLWELLYYMENYYLEFREQLGFEQSATFGLELELEQVILEPIKNQFRNEPLLAKWILKHDNSLENGLEINSPILTDKRSSWDNLKEVCSIVEKYATIGKNSGGHIHIGTQVLGEKAISWLQFIKLWSIYENIIYRFCYGEYLSARKSIGYARAMANNFWSDYLRLTKNHELEVDDIVNNITHFRSQAVNFNNVHNNFYDIEENNTIEFRCPNGSMNPIIWQNNVNFLLNLLQYSKSEKYDDDIVMKRREKNEDKYSSLIWYDEIYLEQALELCDMIFTNNVDKIYFLRQYLKSFQVSNKVVSKAKTFTKK